MLVIMHIGLLAEKINKKILVIKIVERSKSIKNKAYLWYYQISKGISEILKYAHIDIKEFQDIRKKRFFYSCN